MSNNTMATMSTNELEEVITSAISELGKRDLTKAMALTAGAMVGVYTAAITINGGDSSKDIIIVGESPTQRRITIHSLDDEGMETIWGDEQHGHG